VNLSIYEFPLILIFHFLSLDWPKSHTSCGDFEASEVPTWSEPWELGDMDVIHDTKLQVEIG